MKNTEKFNVDDLLNSVMDKEYSLVVYNDDKNAFNAVILIFVMGLKHTLEQAEQCATLIHHSGKCKVKNGKITLLEPMLKYLTECGLTAKIE